MTLSRHVHEGNVHVLIDGSSSRGPFPSFWNAFGYDEPNYTTARNGQALLQELSSISPRPPLIRCHNLLTSGNGEAALKWGSTNVYTEDQAGAPVYNWTILDEIFDTFVKTGVRPLVEIGFMPEGLSAQPQPYRHQWPEGPLFTGWAYPPKDYHRWGELVSAWAGHCVERYGDAVEREWLWELWNEPDIGYWQGSFEEYCRLYDFTVAAIKRTLPGARLGGPHTTGPASDRAASFLQRFLDHCASGHNSATGGTGSPLDFVAFHAKGAPKVVDGRVRMGLSAHLHSIRRGFEIVTASDRWKRSPIVIGESDPEGCAACPASRYPENAYRNGVLYATYTAELIDRTFELAASHGANLLSSVTWAFEFEDQPYFAGFRTLATNGIAKPVLNLFRMIGMLRGDLLEVESSARLPIGEILAHGVQDRPNIGVMAARDDASLCVLLWSYHDDENAEGKTTISIQLRKAPSPRVKMSHFRIDERHSNAWTVWREMGQPPAPDAEQYRQLQEAGSLQQCEPPRILEQQSGEICVDLSLPPQAISLLRFDRMA